MRVALVVYGDLGYTSGGFLYDRKLVDYLRGRGDDVDVVSLPWRTYPRHLRDNLSPAVHSRLRGDYDLVLQDEFCHPSLVLPNRLHGAEIPIVSLVHSPKTAETRSSPWHRLYRTVEAGYHRTVDGAICPSRATAETVAEVADVATTVVRPGRGHRSPSVSAADVADRATDGPLRVLFLGSVVPRKGLDVLVDGLAALPSTRWQLTAVGSLDADSGYARRIRRQVDRLGVDERVTLTGRLADEAVDDHLRRSHLLAVPSRYEAFGIGYLEGMGFGLPALATTSGGANEIVTDGENGFLVEPEDPGAIAAALEPLLGDRDRLCELGVAARVTYESHPTWDDTGRRVRELLATMVDRGERTATDRHPSLR